MRREPDDRNDAVHAHDTACQVRPVSRHNNRDRKASPRAHAASVESAPAAKSDATPCRPASVNA